MPRPLTLMLVLPALLSGCGDEAPDNSGVRPTEAVATPATPRGVTETVFNTLELRSPRAEVEKRLGEPVKRSKPNAGTECLDYPALDASSKPLPGTRYRVCFNEQDQLSVRTTVGSAG